MLCPVPFGPIGPGSPFGPVGPVGPAGPCGPCGPGSPPVACAGQTTNGVPSCVWPSTSRSPSARWSAPTSGPHNAGCPSTRAYLSPERNVSSPSTSWSSGTGARRTAGQGRASRSSRASTISARTCGQVSPGVVVGAVFHAGEPLDRGARLVKGVTLGPRARRVEVSTGYSGLKTGHVVQRPVGDAVERAADAEPDGGVIPMHRGGAVGAAGADAFAQVGVVRR